MRAPLRTLLCVVSASFLAASVNAASIPLVNNSFENFVGGNANNTIDDGVTPPDGNGRIMSVDGSTAPVDPTIPGWILLRTSGNTQPRGWDDDKGGFDGTRYAFMNNGAPGVVWSDASGVGGTYSAGDWLTVTWSQAVDTPNVSMFSRGYLSFNNSITSSLPAGQTGQGGITRVAATQNYDTSLGGNGGAQNNSPGRYTTHSVMYQLTADDAAGANANGIRVGVSGDSAGNQWHLDNILLDQVTPNVVSTILMDPTIANGSFEDVAGGAVTSGSPLGSNNTGVPTSNGAWRLATTSGGGTTEIPGWTVATSGLAGFDNDRAPSDGNVYAFANGTPGGDGVYSGVFGDSVIYAEGDIIRVSYDHARNNGTGSLGFNTFLGFTGSGIPSTFIGRGEYDVSLVGDGADAYERETLLYRLTAADAALANANGLMVRMDMQNNDSNQWRLDNVVVERLTVIPEPGSIVLLIGLCGAAFAYRKLKEST